jgi:hypothetical protein
MLIDTLVALLTSKSLTEKQESAKLRHPGEGPGKSAECHELRAEGWIGLEKGRAA